MKGGKRVLALVTFIAGGMCGFFLAALLHAGVESFRVWTLEKKLEAVKAVAKYWEKKYEELAKELEKGARVEE